MIRDRLMWTRYPCHSPSHDGCVQCTAIGAWGCIHICASFHEQPDYAFMSLVRRRLQRCRVFAAILRKLIHVDTFIQ